MHISKRCLIFDSKKQATCFGGVSVNSGAPPFFGIREKIGGFDSLSLGIKKAGNFLPCSAIINHCMRPLDALFFYPVDSFIRVVDKFQKKPLFVSIVEGYGEIIFLAFHLHWSLLVDYREQIRIADFRLLFCFFFGHRFLRM